MNPLFVLFLAYLVVPKVDLILDGIRPEDFIFVIALVVFVFQRPLDRFVMPLSMKYYLIFIALNFLSAAFNFGLNGFSGILFSARLLQYVFWYPIILKGCRDLTSQQIVRGFTIVSIILIGWGALEFFGLIPKVGNFGGATSRLSLNTGGPYEAAVMVAMLGYIVNGAVLTPLLLVVVLLTQARITTAGVAVGYVFVRPGRTALLAAVLGFSALIAAPQIQDMLEGSRYQQQKSSYSMLGLLRFEWSLVPTLADPAIFREAFIKNLQDVNYMPDTLGDMSFKYRAVRWPIVYKSTSASLTTLLVGFGPGAWGNALDGYHARVFGEVGLLGVVVFLMWLTQLFRESPRRSVVCYSLLVMSISALFIDIFVSSKVMPLLWAFAAMQAARHPAAMVGEWRTALGRRKQQAGLAYPAVVPGRTKEAGD